MSSPDPSPPGRSYTVLVAATALAVATLCGLAAHLWTGPVTVPTPASVEVDPAASAVQAPRGAGESAPSATTTAPVPPTSTPPPAPPTTAARQETPAATPTTTPPVVVTPDRPVVQSSGGEDDGAGQESGDR